MGIDHEGSIVIEDDITKFPSRVIDLLLHPEICKELGLRCRSIVERHYDWRTIVGEIGGFYDRITSRESLIPSPSEIQRLMYTERPLPFWLDETISKRRFTSAGSVSIELPAVVRGHVIERLRLPQPD